MTTLHITVGNREQLRQNVLLLLGAIRSHREWAETVACGIVTPLGN
jgi:hypothetical protein